ncbi:MAG: right-handed parallel beta-helix repeat-containing protein [Clostridia bacterium]|nr:right-handed parallel beta-helix repeat-containing protein [Clostridia bacterium]
MLKKARKCFAAVLAVLFVCFTASPALTASAATQTSSWNFKDSSFKSLGTIKASTTINGLGLIATSSKTMAVKSNSVTVSGTSYTYCLALSGTGSTSYRAVKVPVSGSDTIKVVLKSSGSSTRNLVVADSNGKKLGTIAAKSSASLGTYSYSGSSGYVYLYSENSGINIYKIQVDSNGSSSSGSSSSGSSSSGSSSSGSSSSGSSSSVSGDIVVKNGGTSLADALKKAKSGQTVVIDGTVKSGAVSLPAGVNLAGKNNATIDFSQTSGSSGRGITISGNGSTLSNITIKNASDNGIFISGSNNTLKYVTCCYNEDAGFQVSNGGANNKFYNCYSHHNADAKGENADGFAVKLHSGEGNYFENCVAEYNSDDGWDCYAAHGAVKLVNCQANYNGLCNGIYGDGNGFKMGGVDNKTPGVAAHLDPLKHELIGCTAKGNYANGFDRNNQSGVVTMKNCTADSNKGKNYNWPLNGTPSALGYKVTFGKAIIQDCTNINGKNNLTGATLVGNCKGF